MISIRKSRTSVVRMLICLFMMFGAIASLGCGIKNMPSPDNEIPIATETKSTYFEEIADRPAQFPEGKAALRKYIKDNMPYPYRSLIRGVEGWVVISASVSEDGTLSDAKVVKSLDKHCDKAALKTVKKMPNWEPAIQNGMPVSSIVYIKIYAGAS